VGEGQPWGWTWCRWGRLQVPWTVSHCGGWAWRGSGRDMLRSESGRPSVSRGSLRRAPRSRGADPGLLLRTEGNSCGRLASSRTEGRVVDDKAGLLQEVDAKLQLYDLCRRSALSEHECRIRELAVLLPLEALFVVSASKGRGRPRAAPPNSGERRGRPASGRMEGRVVDDKAGLLQEVDAKPQLYDLCRRSALSEYERKIRELAALLPLEALLGVSASKGRGRPRAAPPNRGKPLREVDLGADDGTDGGRQGSTVRGG
jgi:hypothetical protein